jgi:segregation and condensation protein B
MQAVPQQLRSVAARYNLPSRLSAPRLAATHRRAGSDGIRPDPPAAAIDGERPGAGDGRLSRLEAVLFVAREPLSTRKLSQYANLADATEARTLIRQLNDQYDQIGRAFRVEEVAGGYLLMTRPKFAAWLRRLDEVPKELRLSAPALETLAVIAYRQPAGRAEIEAIRGVNCGEILRQLMDRELVRIAGRGDELGRPYLYVTTKRFLQLFGLRTLDELPRAADMKGRVPGPPPTTSSNSATTCPECSEEESQVTAIIRSERAPEELKKLWLGNLAVVARRDDDPDEDLGDEEVEDNDEDLDEDLDDEEFEDDEFDESDEEDLDDDDDFEDDEWEEVDDEEEDEDWDDEEDEDWDDEEDDEEEEEEEEGWE